VPLNTSGVKPISGKYNFSALYNPGEKAFNPEYRILFNNDTTVSFIFKLDHNELQNMVNVNETKEIRLLIKYVLRETEEFRIVDSSVIIQSLGANPSEDVLSYFQIHLPQKSKCKLLVNMSLGNSTDLQQRVIADIDNRNEFSKDYFVLYELQDGDNKTIKFNNFVSELNEYVINSNYFENFEVNVEYYKFQEYVCIPPYYLVNPTSEIRQPDSVFVYTIGDNISFDHEGYFVLKAQKEGVASMCLVNVGRYYPEIKTLYEMLEPLKLITGNKEFRELEECSDLKTAIDQFWLSKSNNVKFAKEQIRVFYNRVNLANKYFTEDKAGWKTDRGNIYILFGPPSFVNISESGEEWFYGENPELAGVLFVFDKTSNIYCGSSVVLRRDSDYQSVWSQAVSTWRDGRIFTITNQ